jgi:hypothetical protein
VSSSIRCVGAAACVWWLQGCDDPYSAVMARSSSGATLRWAQPIVEIGAVLEHGTEGDSRLQSALHAAARAWNRALARRCKAPRIAIADTVAGTMSTDGNGRNDVILHQRRWCPSPRQELECYEAELHGFTRILPRVAPGSPADGEALEADVHLNGTDFRWSHVAEEPGTLSLSAILVHELGHVLGLDHPCGPGAGDLRCAGPTRSRAVMNPDAAELGVGEVPEPLVGEAAAVCRAHGSSLR